MDMRCIFCKRSSVNSRSVEHIIPESLGNSTAVLPAGIVCDKCNNYFSQNVEKPFLNSEAVRLLRFHQAIPSKKGRIPSVKAVLSPNFTAAISRPKTGPYAGIVELEPEAYRYLMTAKEGKLIVASAGKEPDHNVVSRFLAKVASEAIADRLMYVPGGVDYLIDEKQFDPIRRYAREGYPVHWPHKARRIYDQDRKLEERVGIPLQTVWEYDFLQTRQNELYFVLAIFGLELTINVGGPDMEGYESWLKENGEVSPLYVGKNA
jgi:hypothetical protein